MDQVDAAPSRSFTRRGRAGFLILPLCLTIIMLEGFDLQSIGFVAPEIAKAWSVGLAQFGVVFSAGLGGSLLGALLAGPLSRALGLRRVVMGALTVFGLATLGMAAVDRLLALDGLRFVAGLGMGAATPAVMAIVANASGPRHRTALVTLTVCGQPLGAILGAQLCAHFIPVFGWTFAFWVGGVAPLVLLAPLIAVRLPAGSAPEPAVARAETFSELFTAPVTRTTLLMGLSGFCGVVFIYLVVNYLPGGMRSAGYSLAASIRAISLFNVGGIGGALIIGALVDRYGPLRVAPAAFVLAAIGFGMLGAFEHRPAVFLAATLLSGLAGYGGMICVGALAMVVFPDGLRTTGAGWTLAIGRLGGALSPLLASALLAMGLGVGRLYAVCAVMALLVAVFMHVLTHRRPQVAA